MAQNNENMAENLNNEAKNHLNIKPAGIDKDNLVLMREEDFKESVSTEKGFRRFMLNAFAEILSVIHDLHKDVELTNDVLTMAFANEMQDYYAEQVKGINHEKAMQIVEKSHQKSKKSKK